MKVIMIMYAVDISFYVKVKQNLFIYLYPERQDLLQFLLCHV